jgi:hypothetical protein
MAKKIVSMKNSIDTIGNQTCDLPTCSAVPQQTAPLHAPFILVTMNIKHIYVQVTQQHHNKKVHQYTASLNYNLNHQQLSNK